MRHVVVLCCLASCLLAQSPVQITSPQPAAPGSIINVTITNPLTIPLDSSGEPTFVMTSSGRVVEPNFGSDYTYGFLPGVPRIVTRGVPGLPTIRNLGSYLLICHVSDFSVTPIRVEHFLTRMDIGVADPSFPSLHGFPEGAPLAVGAHAVSFSPNASTAWEIGNSTNAPLTVPGGASLEILAPGGTTSLATVFFGGMTIGAGRVIKVPLPLAGLTPGPYTVRTTWLDPVTGGVAIRTHGIQDAGKVDLRLPHGQLIPSNGTLPIELSLDGFLPNIPFYYVVLAFQPGTTPIGGGLVLPFTLTDPLVQLSVQSAAGGIIQGQVAQAIPVFQQLPVYFGLSISTGIRIQHPGAFVSGIGIRAAALGIESGAGTIGLSQSEELLFQ